jgi:uncharacterized protein (TIGR02001 family)
MNTRLNQLSLAAAALISVGFVQSAAAAEAPAFAYSFNIGATNDYVFRGVAQAREKPSGFGGLDLTYGMGYVGVWAANVDFGRNADATGSKIASTEIDIYAGIKPTLGPATFDLGVIYYAYPGANDDFRKGQLKEQDYFEIKGGVSGAFIPMLPKLTLGGVVFYSPEYQGGQNEVFTTEASLSYEFPAIGKVTPSFSALLGAQYGDAKDGFALANGKDDLLYWNAGITLAVEKFSFDFRYWDTNISNTGALSNNFCNGVSLQCDERFSFTAKFTY